MSYLSSTETLARALAREIPVWRSGHDETYFVHTLVLELFNQAYATLGMENYRREGWPAPEVEVMAALGQVVSQRPQDYARHSAAYALVRFGNREPEVMSALHPWDRVMFDWQARAYTVDSLVESLGRAGLMCTPNEQGREVLERRLANPLDNLGDHWGITFSLLEGRAVFQSLRDIGFTPEHHALFASLCGLVGLDVSEVSQTCNRDEVLMATGQSLGGVPLYSSEGANWIVSYRLGKEWRWFAAEARGTWMDSAAVMVAFDALMAELGRPERAFQFESGRDDNEEFGAFLAADRLLFPRMAGELGLPIKPAG